MIALVVAAARGRSADGFGPHRFRQPFAHQIRPPATQNTLEASVAVKARCFNFGFETAIAATATSIGKYAGKVARHCPTLHATPLPPPAKPDQTG
jgi:hypothetical protein